MKLLAEIKERRCGGRLATQAMLEHRLRTLQRQRQLISHGLLQWVFYFGDASRHLCLIECSRLEDADSLLKASPLFSFSTAEVLPVVTSDAVVTEIRSALQIRSDDPPTAGLVAPARHVRKDGSYWCVRKELPSLDPLSSKDSQSDILLRTIESKELVCPEVEFADLNAVGRMVGYLVGEGTREAVEAYVQSCALYADLVCRLERLLTLDQAQSLTEHMLSEKPLAQVDLSPNR